MTTQTDPFKRTQREESILPKDWLVAPLVWYKQQRHAALTFLVVNFLFGTLGLWLPLVNAGLFKASPLCHEILKLFRDGGFYLYAVPFLAATTGSIFSSIAKDSVEYTRGTKTLLAFLTTIVFFGCAILMQIQLLGPKSSRENLNFFLQAVVALLAILIAVYGHAILQNESSGSARTDMEEGAAGLQAKAADASVSKKDFE